MHWVAAMPEITPLFTGLQDDNMPFGLPVIFRRQGRVTG